MKASRTPLVFAFLIAFPVALAAQSTITRVSVTGALYQMSAPSWEVALSGDGRYVAFVTDTPGLPGNAVRQIWIRDRVLQTVTLASVNPAGLPCNGGCDGPTLSEDGRFLAFTSGANDLVASDTNGLLDVFVRDLLLGTTERVSVSPSGGQGNGTSRMAAISGDGRFVAFNSLATNLVQGWPSGQHVYRHDRMTGATEPVDVRTNGTAATLSAQPTRPSISGDGHLVTFESSDATVVSGDTNAAKDVFLRDFINAITTRVSLGNGGTEATGISTGGSLSADGLRVAFVSHAANLVPGDTNGSPDAFVRDLVSGTTERVSVGTLGQQGSGTQVIQIALSSDGRYAVFSTDLWGLDPTDASGSLGADVYLHDRVTGQTSRESLASDGATPNDHCPLTAYPPWTGYCCQLTGFGSYGVAISGDGRLAAFQGAASNLVAGDTNGFPDAFLRDHGCHASFFAFGAGLAGTGGHVPVLSGLEGQCAGGWLLFAANVVGGAAGYLIASPTQLVPPMPAAGGLIHVAPFSPSTLWLPIAAGGPTGVAGTGFWAIADVDATSLHGTSLYLQAVFSDAAGPAGLSMTNAVRVDF
jgi:Tol biopolymer transport system component